MSIVKTQGIVLKEVNYGEADKILTVFSRNMGKITASARGARRPKSKLIAGAQFLCFSDFVLFKGREMYSVSSCDVVESFYDIRVDVEKLTYAAHIISLVNNAIQEEQPSSRLLQLLLNTLHMLSKTNKSPELITRVFEVRFISIIGYAPVIDVCSGHGGSLELRVESGELRVGGELRVESGEFPELFFSFKNCGVMCKACGSRDISAARISYGTYLALRHIIKSNIKDIFSFDVSPQILDELYRITKRYIKDRLEKNFDTLDFLKQIKFTP